MRLYNSNKNCYFEGHRIQIFPTEKQKEYIERTFELTRYVWNWALEQEQNNYILFKEGKAEKTFLNIFDLKKLFTEARKHNIFLEDIQYETAVYVIRNAITSFENYFKRNQVKISYKINKPKFKSKKNNNYIPLRNNTTYFENNMLRVPGLPIGDKIFTNYYTNATKKDHIKYYKCGIKKDNLGNYWFCFAFEKEKPINYFKENNIPQTEAIGIDLNVQKTIVCSNGEIFSKPNLNKINKRIKRLSRAVMKDYRALQERQSEQERTNSAIELLPSKNANKRTDKLRKAYKKKFDKINNFIYQSVSRIIKMNPKAIVMEDLDVADMNKLHNIAKYTSECNFGKIYQIIQYKCEVYNIPFIVADRYYKSSQLCSNCNSLNNSKNSNRLYHCNNCGLIIDRDLNAAKNLAKLAENYDYNLEELIIA